MTFDISTRQNSEDFETLKKAVNMGIDSHLEGFTKSKFYGTAERFFFCFDTSELSTLLRRLGEIDDENAMSLEYSIIYSHYGIELI